MILTKKQTVAIEYLETPGVTEVLFGGAAGGGKSAFGCYWLLKMCIKYPGTRWLAGRAKLKIFKQTTLKTFFEIAFREGVRANEHFRYNAASNVISFYNGSEILIKDLFYYPSDPNFDSLGSLEISGGFIDECNEITEKAKNVVKSRIRYKLDEFDIEPKLFMSCNPAKNWVYSGIYDPWRRGELPEHIRFVPALLSDNPHISKHYRKNLLSLDKASIERLLHGNWDYEDDPTKLMSFDSINDLKTNIHVFDENAKKYITADIALHGSDRFVVIVWQGFTVIELNSYEKTEGDEVTKLLMEKADEHGVRRSHICFDSDGVGAYLRGYLKGAKSFINNGRPVKMKGEKQGYQNLKSQCYFNFAKRVEAGGYFMKHFGSYWDLISEELAVIKNRTHGKDGKLAVNRKQDIKELIGRSPDFADALMMREYFELKHRVVR